MFTRSNVEKIKKELNKSEHDYVHDKRKISPKQKKDSMTLKILKDLKNFENIRKKSKAET